MKSILNILIFITLLMPMSLLAQKMNVQSFSLQSNDMTANLEGTIVYDQNDNKCALIKIETTEKGFTFDVGVLGIVKTEYHPGEIWLYVPYGVKTITISHPTFGVIRDYDLGMSVKQAKTYLLQLTTDRLITNVIDYSQTQTLEISLHPKSAQIAINGMVEPVNSSGKISKTLSFGTYSYRVTADDYHTEEGVIEINDPNKKHTLDVSLKKAYGYLNINTDPKFDGAKLYVDDALEGVLPIYEFPIKSGTYKITLVKKLYKPYTQTITISDDKTTQIAPMFEPNYAMVDIIAEQGAKIYVDGEYMSQREWKGPLELGEHKIECKKENHRSTTKTIKLSSLNSVKYTCEPPQPIYGSINITSDPINAEVKLNGEKIGVTPLNRANVLIGTYDIEISKQGYDSKSQQITVRENETSTLNKTLSKYCYFPISSVPSGASLFVNGIYRGTTPVYIKEEMGEHKIELKYSGYKDYSKKMTLDGSTTDQTIKLKRQFYYPEEFYMNFNGRIMGLSGMEFGMGGYKNNFNFEFLYQISFDESEKINMLEKTDFYGYTDLFSSDNYNQYSYKYQSFGLRTGYGIICGTRVRITPQVGLNYVVLREKDMNYDSYTPEGGVLTGVVAAKISCALGRIFALEVSPEYGFILGGSERYKLVSNLTDDIKKSTSGFTIKVGFNIYFDL